MGGRDCSLQMHEQKLLEVSVTVESLQAAIEEAERSGQKEEARVLRQDLITLQEMEDEAARFGQAVGLDSVSTFECIVDRDKHFFMEMNTRIQVEHRVTELCYALKFSNPDKPEEHFEVESLVEAMVLLAAHGEKLPRPERKLRNNDSVEARLNATNQALQPHAGGVIGSYEPESTSVGTSLSTAWFSSSAAGSMSHSSHTRNALARPSAARIDSGTRSASVSNTASSSNGISSRHCTDIYMPTLAPKPRLLLRGRASVSYCPLRACSIQNGISGMASARYRFENTSRVSVLPLTCTM